MTAKWPAISVNLWTHDIRVHPGFPIDRDSLPATLRNPFAFLLLASALVASPLPSPKPPAPIYIFSKQTRSSVTLKRRKHLPRKDIHRNASPNTRGRPQKQTHFDRQTRRI